MPTVYKKISLWDLIQQRGLLSPPQISTIAEEDRLSQSRLQTALIAAGMLSEEQLGELLAEQYGLPFDRLENYRVEFDLYPDILPEWMSRHAFVPLRVQDGCLTIAVAAPHDVPALDQLERLLGKEPLLVVAPRSAILEAIELSQKGGQMVARVKEEFRPVLLQENEHCEEILSTEKIQRDQSPVVQLIDTIILNALQK